MTDLITEARELCESATPGPWYWQGALLLTDAKQFLVLKPYYNDDTDNVSTCVMPYDAAFIARSRTLVPELCDALEKAQEQNKQLIREVSALAAESVKRDVALAKLEAEVMAVTEPKRGEWVEAKSGVMSVWPPGQVMCSVCGQRMPSQWKKMPPYCYGCGAKMESEGST